MLQNYLKIALRHLAKNKTASIINLSGLTIGLATAMLIGLFVLNEWQTDRSLPHPDRTFRLLRTSSINNEPYDIGVTSAPFAPALEQDFPADVEETLRVLDGNSLVSIGEQRFEEEKYFYTDPNFFTFFDLPLLYGDPATVLSKPHSIVLSEKTARRYFGSEHDAVGKTLRIDNDYDATVTGVFAEMKSPLHLDFDLVESNLSLHEEDWWTVWWNNNHSTYVRLSPGVAASDFSTKLPKFVDKYFAEDFERTGARIDLRLQAIRDVYFEADVRYDFVRHGDRQAVGIFLFAAVLLILIACANYVNLSTARSIERGKEVGIYKVLGSGRGRIVAQMLGESLLLTAVSVLLACQLVTLALPWFERMFEVELAFKLPALLTAAGLLGLTLLVTLASGLYPGWLLSSFRPATVLKGAFTPPSGGWGAGLGGGGLRQALVVTQFVLSVGLLCSTLVVRSQLDFLKSKNLGFDKENILVLRANNPAMYDNRAAYRQRLEQEPGVRQMSFLSGLPGGMHDATTVDIPSLNRVAKMRTAFGDFDFVKTFGLQITAGRDFDPRLASDSTRAAILNERAVADLGLTNEEVLGKEILLSYFDTIPRRVVGVVKDYHFTSLHDAIEPLVISTVFWGGDIAVKVQGERTADVLAAAEKAWNEQAPAFPFAYQFLDERLDRLYRNEARQGRIFGLFAGIAIFIACLGMFGLAAFAASTRTKEIGIRKVLGATTAGIVGLLSKDFLKPVLLALVIASPLAYFFMEKWLEDFAYRIDIQWTVFALAGVAAILIAGLTVSFQSVKAALADPVKSLRSE